MPLFIPLGLIGVVGSIALLYVFEGVRGRERALVLKWSVKVISIVVVLFAVALWALQARPQDSSPTFALFPIGLQRDEIAE